MDDMTKVKICGITNSADALAAIEAGADMLGFLVVPRSGAQFVSKQQTAEIIPQLPERVMSVVVTMLEDVREIVDLVRDTHAKAVQLHGDVLPEEVADIKQALPGIQIIKTIHVRGEAALDEVRQYDGLVDMILLDSAHHDNTGGTGKTHDWQLSKRIVDSVSVPVILAGGLNPENVAEAIGVVHPYGVDARSGVSNTDGTKDLEKVRQFIVRAKHV